MGNPSPSFPRLGKVWLPFEQKAGVDTPAIELDIAPGAEQSLLGVVRDAKQPGIVRATAVSLLPPYLTDNSAPTLQKV